VNQGVCGIVRLGFSWKLAGDITGASVALVSCSHFVMALTGALEYILCCLQSKKLIQSGFVPVKKTVIFPFAIVLIEFGVRIRGRYESLQQFGARITELLKFQFFNFFFSGYSICMRWIFIGLFLLSVFPFSGYAAQEIWILIDTSEQKLSVMREDEILLVFDDIAIGRYGASRSRMKGSNQTPLGSFQISWIKRHNRYHRFYGINYPNQEVADLALAEGRISRQVWESITSVIESTGMAPQDTSLGGYIGIHGIGKGDQAIHSRFNWTNGCVAVTNTQIDQLAPWITLGTRIVIQ